MRIGLALAMMLAVSLDAVRPARAQNSLGNMFGNLIQMAMIRETWNRLGPEMNSCLDAILQPEGTSIDGLAGNGVPANDPRVQGYVQRCNGIISAARAWRASNPKSKACVGRLLQETNQTINGLAEAGVGPGDPQVRQLFVECDQIDAARAAWAQLDSRSRSCLGGLLGRAGQSIDQLADRHIGPADPQVLPLVDDCQRIDAARTAWSVVDRNVKACAVAMLRRNGQTVETLIDDKVAPSDPQIAQMMAQCNMISAQGLLKNISCVIDGQPSTCDEAYVLESAKTSPLAQDQLVSALIARENVGKMPIELPEAKRQRLAEIAARRKAAIAEEGLRRLAPLADPTNAFASAKAIDLRKRIEAARASAKTTEADMVRLESETRALADANVADLERKRQRDADMAARGEVDVLGEGAGATQKKAKAAAYVDLLDRQLRELIAGQADGNVGQTYRAQVENDVERFKAQFMAGTPAESCRKAKGVFSCRISGVFRFGTLKSEIQKTMTAALSPSGQGWRFILSYEEKDDEPRRFLIDAIRAEFVNSGYRVIARSAEDEARAKGDFDYFLNILDISYDNGSSDIGSIGGSGANVFENYVLSAQVKLLDNNKDAAARQELANVPVMDTKRLPRDARMPKETRRAQLLPMQAAELARRIYKEINARLLTIAASAPPKPLADSVSAPTGRPQGAYAIHIAGLSQKERERIRALRNAVGRVLAGTETRVDPDKTDDKAVEITFDKHEKFDPEDLVDAIYEVFKDRKSVFEVRYDGNGTFAGTLGRTK